MAIVYNSNYDGTTTFSDTCISISAKNTGLETVVVPGEVGTRYQALFQFNGPSNVYVGLNVVPEIPGVGSPVFQQYVEFKPKKRYVTAGDVLYFLTNEETSSASGIAYIGVSLRQLP